MIRERLLVCQIAFFVLILYCLVDFHFHLSYSEAAVTCSLPQGLSSVLGKCYLARLFKYFKISII